MAQLDYFGTWNDSWAMLQDIFARGDIRAYWRGGPYERPEAEHFTVLTNGLKDCLRRTPVLYLFGSFSTHPPLFQLHQGKAHDGKYFLFDNSGGPLISMMLANEGEVDGRLKLLVGDVSTQPEYELAPDHYEKPTPALKAAYADIQKRMKKYLIRHKGIWIGQEALQLLEQGKVAPPAALKAAPTPKQPARTSSASTPPSPPLPRAAGPR
jgi:hypothetical protein